MAGAAGSARAQESEREIEIYGFAQGDVIYDFQRVDPDWEDTFRPSKISVDGQFGTDGQSSISAKQSRFGVRGSMPTGEGNAPLDFTFEFNLLGSGVDAGQTAFHLRHFYGEWGPILAGQTWSLFADSDLSPNVIDEFGPASRIWARNAQIRWTPFRTRGRHLAIAVERPSNDIDPGNVRLIEEFADAEVRPNEELPDLTAQFRIGADWGHVQAAGLLRKVGFEYRVAPTDNFAKGSETGWGINLSSVIKIAARGNVLLGVVHGHAIGTYVKDGGPDLAPQLLSPDPDPLVAAEVLPMTGVTAYYDHRWNAKWSSSIGYSVSQVQNTNVQSDGAFHKGEYASTNLLAYPVENLVMGGEVLWGERENKDASSGHDVRLQFSVKYSFSFKLQSGSR